MPFQTNPYEYEQPASKYTHFRWGRWISSVLFHGPISNIHMAGVLPAGDSDKRIHQQAGGCTSHSPCLSACIKPHIQGGRVLASIKFYDCGVSSIYISFKGQRYNLSSQNKVSEVQPSTDIRSPGQNPRLQLLRPRPGEWGFSVCPSTLRDIHPLCHQI